MLRTSLPRVLAWLCVGVIGACGGTAVVESGTNGVNNPCQTNADCVDGACIGGPERRVCAAFCQGAYDCATGEICDTCATSSCPTCDDCVGACVAASTVGCTNHGDCGPTELCAFGSNTCLPACTAEYECPVGYYCDGCGTSSCPDCDDCRAVCFPVTK